MNPLSGGQPSFSDRQRQAAAEIARRKVLIALNSSREQPSHNRTATYKYSPVQTSSNKQDWQKYHSAWQNYYQKYYSEYYAKAAKNYLESNHAHNQPQPTTTQSISQSQKPSKAVASKQNLSLRERIQKKANANFKVKQRYRKFIPIFTGIAVMLFILFLQYNRLVFAPIMAYISPTNTKDAGITAINPTTSTTPSKDPKLIIPKLNVEVPVNFNIPNDSATIMEAMNHGVAHFKIPGADALPGEKGNLVITGHSAGDIYSNNQYKFIFSGLERLQENDLIYVNYNSKRYTYSVKKKETVEPSDVNSLIYETKKPILTLITCTPLGTARYRLLVTADQIDPAPNTAAEISKTEQRAQVSIPSNEKTFFEKIWHWLIGKKD